MNYPNTGKSSREIRSRSRITWHACATVIAQAQGVITSRGVAKALGKHSTHTSYALAEMHRAGLLEYTQLCTPGHPKAWRLTDKGRALIARGPDGGIAPTLPPLAQAHHDARALMAALGMPSVPPALRVPAREHFCK
jgi:hypothetical protein